MLAIIYTINSHATIDRICDTPVGLVPVKLIIRIDEQNLYIFVIGNDLVVKVRVHLFQIPLLDQKAHHNNP